MTVVRPPQSLCSQQFSVNVGESCFPARKWWQYKMREDEDKEWNVSGKLQKDTCRQLLLLWRLVLVCLQLTRSCDTSSCLNLKCLTKYQHLIKILNTLLWQFIIFYFLAMANWCIIRMNSYDFIRTFWSHLLTAQWRYVYGCPFTFFKNSFVFVRFGTS